MRILHILIIVAAIVNFYNGTSAQELSDGSVKKAMLKALKWQQKNPKHDPRDWTNGVIT